MLLVHCVLAEEDAGLVERLPADAPVHPQVVTAASLAAVVSQAPEGELTGDDAVAHLDLLVALVAHAPLLPLALGTLSPDEAAVREEVLTAQADDLRRRLRAVADFVEVRLDLSFDTDASVAAVARDDPEIEQLSERSRAPGAGMAERMALGEAVAARMAELEARLSEEWLAELTGVAERSGVLHTDEQVRRTAHLVRRDRLDDADAAVARLQDRVGGLAAIEYVGPLPVYSFLDELGSAPEPAPTSRWGW